MGELLKKCFYGCGNEGKYKLKNGKICCQKSSKSCPSIIKKSSTNRTGQKRTREQRKNISLAHIGQTSTKKGLTWEEFYGLEKAKKIKKKISNSKKLTLKKFVKRYPLVYQVDKIKEIEGIIKTKCKNSRCNKWFEPTYAQIYERHRALNNPSGFEENNFYCSDGCKVSCYLYGKTPESLNNYNINQIYTHEEYTQFIDEVLIRQFIQFGYNFCEMCERVKGLNVHHEKPKKTHPHLALDPDNGLILCKKCHIEIGHKKGSECSFGNLSRVICFGRK